MGLMQKDGEMPVTRVAGETRAPGGASFTHLLGTSAPTRFGAEGSEVCSTEQTVKGMVAVFPEAGLVRVWTFSRAFPEGLPAAPAVRGDPHDPLN